MNIADRAGIAEVRHGRLDYYGGRSVDVSPRVGCRVSQPGIPGLDLGALCLRTASS